MEQIGTSWLFSRLFESVVRYFDAFLTLIPLSFVLGFYVSFVASRWWQQFLAIPWPDKLYHSLALYIPGYDEESRMLRRCLIRWMNLALILVLRSICCCLRGRTTFSCVGLFRYSCRCIIHRMSPAFILVSKGRSRPQ